MPACPIARTAIGTTRASRPGKEHPIFARRKGAPGCTRRDPARRQRARRRARLLSDRRAGDLAGRHLAGVLRGHGGPAPIHPALQESAAPARSARSAIRRRRGGSRLGRRQPHAAVRREGSRDPARPVREKTCARRRTRGSDALVFEQTDKSFYTGVSKSKSDRFIFIHMESTVSSEWRYARGRRPGPDFKIFLPHERDHEYQMEHLGGDFIVRTNWQARNFRLVRVADRHASRDRAHWRDAGRASRRHVHRGLRRVRPLPRAVGAQRRPRQDQHQALASPTRSPRPSSSSRATRRPTQPPLSVNPELDTDLVRYAYSSLTTPTTRLRLRRAHREQILLKRDPVLGSFDPGDYRTEFLFAPARDGTRIPVSLVYRKGFDARRHRAAAAVRLWRLRAVHGPELFRRRA